MAKYIRELLDLPPQVSKGDFVLNLAAGVSASNASATLQNYVVTPQLEACFDQALGFIKSAVDANSSKACYLHGSFGSGKSHFMAVLHLILTGHASARGIPELAEVIARHNAWMTGKKFLLVPYHMIGARSLEDGVLKGYCDFLAKTHPGVTPPPIYRSAALIKQAQQERQRYGDERFFSELNQGGGSDDG